MVEPQGKIKGHGCAPPGVVPEASKPPGAAHAEISFPFLNENQNVFVKTYLTNGGQLVAAYRAAYQNKLGPVQAAKKADQLLNSAAVQFALNQVQMKAVGSLAVKLEDHLATLAELRDLAKAARQYSSAVTAEVARGKASGLYIQKVHVSGTNGGPIQVAQVATDEYRAARAKIIDAT